MFKSQVSQSIIDLLISGIMCPKTVIQLYFIIFLAMISISSCESRKLPHIRRKRNANMPCVIGPGLPPQGNCPDGTVCYEDYHDSSVPYNRKCELDPGNTTFKKVCHDTFRLHMEYGKCEGIQLDREISWRLNEMVRVSSTLGRNANCQYEVEWELRNWYRFGAENLNKYKLLYLLRRERDKNKDVLEFFGGPFCDVGKLLECKENNECGCVEGTTPRRVMTDGKYYFSDHCYLTSGSCGGRDVTDFIAVSYEEKERLWFHYGHPAEDRCKFGNVCAYLDEKKGKCRGSPNS